MSESAMLMERRPERNAIAGEPQVFEKLRELARNGYVPDPEPETGGGLLLRHDSAPDLILHADGRIELPVGQRPKSAIAAAPAPAPEKRRMSKRRTLLIVLMAAAFWFLSMFLTASILSD